MPADDARLGAASNLSETWAQHDVDAALRWALGLAESQRDAALAGIALGASAVGYIDDRLFQPFRSDAARVAALERAIRMLYARYPERARAFAAAHPDPRVRARLEAEAGRARLVPMDGR